MAKIAHLECSKCGEKLSPKKPQTICPRDGGALYVRYDLRSLKRKFQPQKLKDRPATMWRYAEVLPDAEPVSLGEGFTPMLRSRVDKNVFIKDEGANPTGSFKARGLCAAVTMAKAYGLKKLEFLPPAMRPARWLPTALPLASRPISSCPTMFRWPTGSSANPTGRA